MSKVIAVDCDEVLAESMRAILSHHNNMCCGYPIQRENITNYHLSEMETLPISHEQTIPRFNDFMHNFHERIDPVGGAKDVLLDMKHKGYTLVVVTARADELTTPTHMRLENHFADVFIDDNLYHAKAVAKHGIQTFLLDKPRNQEYCPLQHEGITKINHWSEMVID